MEPAFVALLLAVGFPASALASGEAPPADNCPKPAQVPQPPEYPDEAKNTSVGGTVVLLLSLDACGQVLAVEVEKSSGQRALDGAAGKAAATWRFNPPVENGKPVAGKVRVPVNFAPDLKTADMPDDVPPELLAALLQYKRIQVPKVAVNADGTLPANTADPLPFVTGTVQATVAMLEQQAEKQPDAGDGVIEYVHKSDYGLTSYFVFPKDAPYYPALYRIRRVSDGTKAFWAMAWLCEDTAEHCERFRTMLAQMGTQKPFDPPPAPPPHLLKLIE